jgi:hypothetical protein
MSRVFATLFLVATLVHPAALADGLPLPNRPESLKWAVIGDNGTGDRPEYEVATQMATMRAAFPFDMDQSFMLVEIAGAELSFAAISRTGRTVDSGVIHKESKR